MGRVCCLLACSGNIGVALYALYCVAHVVQLSAQVEHLNVSSAEQASVFQLSTQELDSPFGLGKTLKCDRCGRDGPNDYNCCHAGGAWAGMCGDKAMVTRGAANYTWNQGFAVCQDRLKRLKAQRARAETKEVDSLSSEFRVQSHGRPAAPGKFGKTPKCDRCGRDGPNDYNCCHAGGAWAGICGDEAMIARGAANYTWGQGFVACQERLKRSLFKRPIGTIYRKWRRKKRPNRFESRAPRTPGSLRSTPSTPSAASVMASGDSGEECFGGLVEQDDAEFAPYGPGISAEAVDAAYRLLAPSDKVGPHLLQSM